MNLFLSGADKNAEDLALTPDGDFLLATGFGGLPDSVVNEMSIIELSTMQHNSVGIGVTKMSGVTRAASALLELSSHGLDIKQRNDGKHMVAITNHCPRRQVEV